MEFVRIALPWVGVVIGVAAVLVFFQMGSTLNRIETVTTHILAELHHARKVREHQATTGQSEPAQPS